MRRLAATLVLWLGLAAACDVHTTELVGAAQTQLPRDAAAHDAAPGAAQDAAAPAAAMCKGNTACACDNGKDDDKDGLIDGLDPECTGALDNDEHSFATGSDLERGDCLDCFFDDNAGLGDDGCAYPAECLEGRTPGPAASGCGAGTCDVEPRCLDACLPRTPNGCDCFGCCEVRREDGSRLDILLTKQCAVRYLDDEKKCPRCVPHPTCRNTCGQCELCPGKTEADLPGVCRGNASDGGVGHACDEGTMPCGATLPCPEASYCQQGCCLPKLI